MNDEYISRKEAINVIKSLESSMPAKDNYAKGYDAALGRALIAVREVSPAADVQPVKRGEWKINSDGYYPYCSVCGTAADQLTKRLTKYCPECGARMDGET